MALVVRLVTFLPWECYPLHPLLPPLLPPPPPPLLHPLKGEWWKKPGTPESHLSVEEGRSMIEINIVFFVHGAPTCYVTQDTRNLVAHI